MSRRLVTVLLAVLVLAGGLLADRAEEAWPVDRPFVSRGSVGAPVAMEPGVLTVHGARASTALEDEYGSALATGGVWVAVDVAVAGVREPVRVSAWWLTDAIGRSFDATERLDVNVVGHAQPDSPLRGEIAFEVPRDALGELTLHASPSGRTPQLSGVAAVSFRVDEADDAPLTPEPFRLEPR